MPDRFRGRLDVDAFATINRRAMLRALGSSALLYATGGLFSRAVWSQPVFSGYPFSLGIASGDPAPDGFVIWTKIAPMPLAPRGGLPNRPLEVEWAVAADPQMRKVVQSGKSVAHPEIGHSVHVEIEGLEPSRAKPRRPDEDAPACGGAARAAEVRRRGLPEVRGRTLHRVEAHRGRALRLRVPLR